MNNLVKCEDCGVLNPTYHNNCVFCGLTIKDISLSFFAKLDNFLTKEGYNTIIITDNEQGEVTVWENKQKKKKVTVIIETYN